MTQAVQDLQYHYSAIIVPDIPSWLYKKSSLLVAISAAPAPLRGPRTKIPSIHMHGILL
jgi:hypothetical protein